MRSATFSDLTTGNVLRVAFGSRGTQIAVVAGWNSHGLLFVHKWRPKAGWTHLVRLREDQVLAALRDDAVRSKPAGLGVGLRSHAPARALAS